MARVRIVVEIDGITTIKEVVVPDGWNELSADDYPYLASIYLKSDNEMPKKDRQVRTFTLLASKAWPAIELLYDEELYDLLPLVNWVFETMNLKRNYLPTINVGKDVYFGPADDLENLRWGEWVVADSIFTQYAQTREAEYLDKFIAAIYRPAGKEPDYIEGSATYRGDKREKFNGNNVDYRASGIAKLPEIVKKGIYLFYLSCRFNMRAYYPNVFPEPKKNEKARNYSPDEPDFGWMGVHDDLCGEKGRSPEQLEDEFLSTILLSLERGQIKWKKYKREAGK